MFTGCHFRISYPLKYSISLIAYLEIIFKINIFPESKKRLSNGKNGKKERYRKKSEKMNTKNNHKKGEKKAITVEQKRER